MRLISHNSIATLSSAVGIGHSLSGSGAYNPATTYAQDAVVTNSGKTYISRKASNTGHALTDTTWWVEVDNTTGIPKKARWARIQANTQACRYTLDGTRTPTASVGLNLPRSDNSAYPGEVIGGSADLSLVKVIEQTASASLSVGFFA